MAHLHASHGSLVLEDVNKDRECARKNLVAMLPEWKARWEDWKLGPLKGQSAKLRDFISYLMGTVCLLAVNYTRCRHVLALWSTGFPLNEVSQPLK
jgi:hypothetical protein